MATRQDILGLRIEVENRAALAAVKKFAAEYGKGVRVIERGAKRATAATDRLSAATQRSATIGNRAAQKTLAQASAYEKLRISLARARNAVLLFQFGIGALASVLGIGALDRFAQRAQKVTDLRKGFDVLSQRIGATSEFITKMSEAADGLVNRMELMKQANNAVILGVATSEDQFAKLVRTAVKLGRALGLEAQPAIESLVTGIGRQSRLMLDNLGIVVRVEDAYKSYAASIGKTASQLTDLEKKQAFTVAAMTAAETAAEGLGEEVFTLAEGYKVLKTTVSDAADAVVNFANRTAPGLLAGPVAAIRTQLEELNRLRNQIQTGGGLAGIEVSAPLAPAKDPVEARFEAATKAAKQRADAAVASLEEFRRIMQDPKLREEHFQQWRKDMEKVRLEAEMFASAIAPFTRQDLGPGGGAGEILLGDILPPPTLLQSLRSEMPDLQRDIERIGEAYRELFASDLPRHELLQAKAALDSMTVSIIDEMLPGWQRLIDEGVITWRDIMKGVTAQDLPALVELLEEARVTSESFGFQLRHDLEGVLNQQVAQLGSGMVDLFLDADRSAKEFIKNFLKGLVKAVLQALVLRAIMSSIGGPVGAVLGQQHGGLFRKQPPALPKAQQGFLFTGGPRNRDGILTAVRAGEAVLPQNLTSLLVNAARQTRPQPFTQSTSPQSGDRSRDQRMGDVNISFNGTVVDEKSVRRFLEDHPEAFGSAYRMARSRGTL